MQGGIQTYGWCPNMWGHSRWQLHMGYPNIQGASKHMGGVQTYKEVSKHMGGIQTYRRLSKHMWASKHTGGESKHTGCFQQKGGHPNIWVVSKHMRPQNIQGTSKHCSRLKSIASSATHMEASKHTAGLPNIWRHPNIWVVFKHGRHANIQGAVQTYGVKSVASSATHMGASKLTGGVQTWVASIHIGASKCMGVYGHPLSLTKHAFFVLCM